ncbi:MAG: NAD(P)/FAD-dependent oxidoreductase [Geminicoccaceae bacterium]
MAATRNGDGGRRSRATSALAGRYDTLILGAGVHGLAIAYALANQEPSERIAVVDTVAIGARDGRHVTTPIGFSARGHVGLTLQQHSRTFYRQADELLGRNIFYAERGALVLPPRGEGQAAFERRRAAWRLHGMGASVSGLDRARGMAPVVRWDDRTQTVADLPIHLPQVALIDPLALYWGYRGRLESKGVTLKKVGEIGRLMTRAGSVYGLELDAKQVVTPRIVVADPVLAIRLTADIGHPLALVPATTTILVSDVLRHWLDPLVLLFPDISVGQDRSGRIFVRGWRTGEVEHNRVALADLGTILDEALETIPALAGCQATRIETLPNAVGSDGHALVGPGEIDGLWFDVGWGDALFDVAPAVAGQLARSMRAGALSEELRPFSAARHGSGLDNGASLRPFKAVA